MQIIDSELLRSRRDFNLRAFPLSATIVNDGNEANASVINERSHSATCWKQHVIA